MSDSTMFDSHRHVKELVAHGHSEASAETIVNVVRDSFTHHVATKADLAEFRHGLQEQLTKLDGRVTNIETNMATKADIATIQTNLEHLKNDLTWRLLGTLIPLVAVAIAAMKFL